MRDERSRADAFVRALEGGRTASADDGVGEALLREIEATAADVRAVEEALTVPIDDERLAIERRIMSAALTSGGSAGPRSAEPDTPLKERVGAKSSPWWSRLRRRLAGAAAGGVDRPARPPVGRWGGPAFAGVALVVLVGVGSIEVPATGELAWAASGETLRGQKALVERGAAPVRRVRDPGSYCDALERALVAVGATDVTAGQDGSLAECKVQFNADTNSARLDAIRDVLHIAGVGPALEGLVTIRVRHPLPSVPFWRHVWNRVLEIF